MCALDCTSVVASRTNHLSPPAGIATEPMEIVVFDSQSKPIANAAMCVAKERQLLESVATVAANGTAAGPNTTAHSQAHSQAANGLNTTIQPPTDSPTVVAQSQVATCKEKITVYECWCPNRDKRWNAYVSYNPMLLGHSLSQETISGATEEVARQKAEAVLCMWKTQVESQPAEPPAKVKKRNRQKHAGVKPLARSKRQSAQQPKSYADVQHRTSNFKGRGSKVKREEKPLSTLPLAAQVWELNVRLLHMREMYDAAAKESTSWQSKFEKMNALMAAHGNSIERVVRSDEGRELIAQDTPTHNSTKPSITTSGVHHCISTSTLHCMSLV